MHEIIGREYYHIRPFMIDLFELNNKSGEQNIDSFSIFRSHFDLRRWIFSIVRGKIIPPLSFFGWLLYLNVIHVKRAAKPFTTYCGLKRDILRFSYYSASAIYTTACGTMIWILCQGGSRRLPQRTGYKTNLQSHGKKSSVCMSSSHITQYLHIDWYLMCFI